MIISKKSLAVTFSGRAVTKKKGSNDGSNKRDDYRYDIQC